MAERLEAEGLKGLTGVRHGFFTRRGGVSEGIYASLNTGLGSQDARENALENRRRALAVLGGEELVTPLQVHSDICVVVEDPWPVEAPVRADAVATRRPGIAVAVNTADCTPVLFADPVAGVVAAAHAGWKGALGGVLEATVKAMAGLGADPSRIVCAIGPVISRENYEVGPEFHQHFVSENAEHARFFRPSGREGHFMFDLPGFVRMRLERAGVDRVEDLGLCTYADAGRFFSYRRATHRGEPDYGRQLSAIMLTP